MSTSIFELNGIGGRTLDATENTNVVDAMSGAGASFGELIKGVGEGVAKTQLKLTENSAEIAKKMAEQKVEVIAVQETEYDDDGAIKESESHVQYLPLLNFVDPAFYHYPQVKIEGHFVIDSLATEGTTSTVSASGGVTTAFSFAKRPGIFGSLASTVGGSASGGASVSTTNVRTRTNESTAVGHMRLFAQLTPQEGLGVPPPVQVVVGPSINIVEGQTSALTPESAAPNANRVRTMAVTLQLRNKAGDPIDGKLLSITCDGALWDFTEAGMTKTGDGLADPGDLAITIKRVFPPDPDVEHPVDTSLQPFTLNVRFGLVTASVTRKL